MSKKQRPTDSCPSVSLGDSCCTILVSSDDCRAFVGLGVRAICIHVSLRPWTTCVMNGVAAAGSSTGDRNPHFLPLMEMKK